MEGEHERIISLEEVQKHRSKESAWCIYGNGVHDVTEFLDEHPGGFEILLDACGADATKIFDDQGHSDHALQLLMKYKIGVLREEDRSKIRGKGKSEGNSQSGKNCCEIL